MNRLVTLAALSPLLLAPLAGAADIDWTAVDAAIGRQGAEQPGGVHKYAFPRSDLKVSVDGVPIKPALALGGWVAFESVPTGAMLMGDLVLTDTELSPVMARLIADGIEITAIHNHLIRTSVPVLYMHVGGHGDPVQLAATLRAALALSATPPASTAPGPAVPTAPLDLDTAALDKLMGYKGAVNGGVYQFSVPRAETITEGGMAVPPAMGTAIPLNFEPTGAEERPLRVTSCCSRAR